MLPIEWRAQEVLDLQVLDTPENLKNGGEKHSSLFSLFCGTVSDEGEKFYEIDPQVDPVMTCYKLVTTEFKWFGLQNKVESFIQVSML
jgi:hypothetical protein